MDYNKTTVIKQFVSGGTAGNRLLITFPQDFMIKKVWVAVITAGAAGTHAVRISNLAADTDYFSLTVGTSAANTVLSGSLEEDVRAFEGGTPLLLRNVNNSTSSAYEVFILCSHSE